MQAAETSSWFVSTTGRKLANKSGCTVGQGNTPFAAKHKRKKIEKKNEKRGQKSTKKKTTVSAGPDHKKRIRNEQETPVGAQIRK